MDSKLVDMAQIFGRRSAKRAPITLDVHPVESEELSASQYLVLAESNPTIIKATRIVAPQPGKPGFGRILVSYKHPIYKAKTA